MLHNHVNGTIIGKTDRYHFLFASYLLNLLAELSSQLRIIEICKFKIRAMSLLSDNVIPGNQGRVFATNAKLNGDLEKIRNKLLAVDGIEEVKLNLDSFPKEFVVHTRKLVSVEDIEEIIRSMGFHAIPKEKFEI